METLSFSPRDERLKVVFTRQKLMWWFQSKAHYYNPQSVWFVDFPNLTMQTTRRGELWLVARGAQVQSCQAHLMQRMLPSARGPAASGTKPHLSPVAQRSFGILPFPQHGAKPLWLQKKKKKEKRKRDGMHTQWGGQVIYSTREGEICEKSDVRGKKIYWISLALFFFF